LPSYSPFSFSLHLLDEEAALYIILTIIITKKKNQRYSKEPVKAMDIEQAGKATEGQNQSQQKLAKLIYKNSAPNGSKIVYPL
jgi:hypothetical protein